MQITKRQQRLLQYAIKFLAANTDEDVVDDLWCDWDVHSNLDRDIERINGELTDLLDQITEEETDK